MRLSAAGSGSRRRDLDRVGGFRVTSEIVATRTPDDSEDDGEDSEDSKHTARSIGPQKVSHIPYNSSSSQKTPTPERHLDRQQPYGKSAPRQREHEDRQAKGSRAKHAIQSKLALDFHSVGPDTLHKQATLREHVLLGVAILVMASLAYYHIFVQGRFQDYETHNQRPPPSSSEDVRPMREKVAEPVEWFDLPMNGAAEFHSISDTKQEFAKYGGLYGHNGIQSQAETFGEAYEGAYGKAHGETYGGAYAEDGGAAYGGPTAGGLRDELHGHLSNSFVDPSGHGQQSRLPEPNEEKNLVRSLTGAQCRAMLHDGTHIFRRMWAAEAWTKMERDRPACWAVNRAVSANGQRQTQDSAAFFADTLAGTHCSSTNWYEGNQGALGREGHSPTFRHPEAAGLLGFDETIDDFCASALGGWDHARNHGHAQRCVEANLNILSLYGHRLPYNMCRNLEWMVCASQGRLPGQGRAILKFSRAPSTLQPGGSSGKPLGKCCGWTPEGMHPRGGAFGYATDDIFYLEVCLFAQICENGEDLFSMKVGDPFECIFSATRFSELQELLLSPWSEPTGTEQCTAAKKCVEFDVSPEGVALPPTCSQCYRVNQGEGDCSALPGCNADLCGFCTND